MGDGKCEMGGEHLLNMHVWIFYWYATVSAAGRLDTRSRWRAEKMEKCGK